MGQSIEVDDQVYEWLQGQAEPFVDTPNSVLRRMAGLENDAVTLALVSGTERAGRSRQAAPERRRKRGRSAHSKSIRVPKGVLLPVTEYYDPLLGVLAEMGGSGPTSTVIKKVGDRMRQKLTPLDRAKYGTGGVRWENRVQFARLRLIETGLIKKNSPKGTWELTDQGHAKALIVNRAS